MPLAPRPEATYGGDMAADVGSLQRQRRRERARRHVRRQRQGTGFVLAAVASILLIVVVLAGSSSPASPRRATRAPASTSAPGPPADAAEIRRTLSHSSYLAEGRRNRKEIALTFDDGPGPGTDSISRWLRRHDVPATFFLVGSAVEADPGAARRLLKAGFALGDHTESHADLSRLDALGQAAEIDRGAAAIRTATGMGPLLFRPPYGGLDDTTVDLLGRRGMLMVLWSVDSEDFERPGADRIAQNVLTNAHAGSVVLLHDGGGDRSQTRAALPAIVKGLRRKGYKLVTVPRLLHDDPPPHNQPPPRSLSGRS